MSQTLAIILTRSLKWPLSLCAAFKLPEGTGCDQKSGFNDCLISFSGLQISNTMCNPWGAAVEQELNVTLYLVKWVKSRTSSSTQPRTWIPDFHSRREKWPLLSVFTCRRVRNDMDAWRQLTTTFSSTEREVSLRWGCLISVHFNQYLKLSKHW